MRIRITFSKTGTLRFTGHLDMHKIWERTARRAGLLIVYSQGFHPLPKIQLAAALPLGFSGRAELVDIWIDDSSAEKFFPTQAGDGGHRCDEIARLLQDAAPPGLSILEIKDVDERAPVLQTQVVSAEYEVNLLEPGDQLDLSRRLCAVKEAVSILRQRRGKTYDLRPLIEDFRLLSYSPATLLFMRLAAREGATGRPEEVLDTLGIAFENTRIERVRLILKSGLKY